MVPQIWQSLKLEFIGYSLWQAGQYRIHSKSRFMPKVAKAVKSMLICLATF
jgi:hypothetical protein